MRNLDELLNQTENYRKGFLCFFLGIISSVTFKYESQNIEIVFKFIDNLCSEENSYIVRKSNKHDKVLVRKLKRRHKSSHISFFNPIFKTINSFH